jgi:hypothetical protein
VDVRLEVPSSESDAVRSGIYGFISRFAERHGEDDQFFSITIIPSGVEFIYDLTISNPAAAAAFVDFLPSVLSGRMTASFNAAR